MFSAALASAQDESKAETALDTLVQKWASDALFSSTLKSHEPVAPASSSSASSSVAATINTALLARSSSMPCFRAISLTDLISFCRSIADYRRDFPAVELLPFYRLIDSSLCAQLQYHPRLPLLLPSLPTDNKRMLALLFHVSCDDGLGAVTEMCSVPPLVDSSRAAVIAHFLALTVRARLLGIVEKEILLSAIPNTISNPVISSYFRAVSARFATTKDLPGIVDCLLTGLAALDTASLMFGSSAIKPAALMKSSAKTTEIASSASLIAASPSSASAASSSSSSSSSTVHFKEHHRLPLAEIKCARCAEYGHYANRCRAPRPDPISLRSASSSSLDGKSISSVTASAPASTPVRVDAPFGCVQRIGKLFYGVAQIMDATLSLPVRYDPGSTASFVSPFFVQSHKFKVRSRDVPFTFGLADSSPVKSSSYIRIPLRLTPRAPFINVRFEVLDSDSSRELYATLGSDILDHYSLTLSSVNSLIAYVENSTPSDSSTYAPSIALLDEPASSSNLISLPLECSPSRSTSDSETDNDHG
jgi:hypothetical protein